MIPYSKKRELYGIIGRGNIDAPSATALDFAPYILKP